MAPLSALLLALYLIAARWLFRGQLDTDPDLRDTLLALDEREMIVDPRLLRIVARSCWAARWSASWSTGSSASSRRRSR